MPADPTAGHLSRLNPQTRVLARALVIAVRQAGYPLIITSSTRSLAEQRVLVSTGRSQTMTSRHLSGDAFDVDIAGMNRSDISAQFWWVLGPWAESALGLVWGGRWASLRDYGHFERRTS